VSFKFVCEFCVFNVHIIYWAAAVVFLQQSAFQFKLRCRETGGLRASGVPASVLNGPA